MNWQNHYFLLRHGQTPYQADQEKTGLMYPFPENPPISLTEKGKEQIAEAVQQLEKENLDLIFSSDFFRTRQTAGIVTKELNLEPVFDSRLRDLDMGEFQGKPKQLYQDFFLIEKKDRFDERPPGGESWNDVKKRLNDFLTDIEKKYAGKNILIISHGDPLWLLAGMLRGFKTEEEFLDARHTDLYPNVGQFIKI